jgi:hypothetical protein
LPRISAALTIGKRSRRGQVRAGIGIGAAKALSRADAATRAILSWRPGRLSIRESQNSPASNNALLK